MPMKSLLTEAINRIEDRYYADGASSGLATGFSELDRRILGLRPSDLIAIGGSPSMGIMTFAINIAVNVSKADRHPTLIFPLKMTRQQVAERMIASTGGIFLTKIQNGKLEDRDWPLMTSSIAQLADLPIFVDDTSDLSPHEIVSRATRLHTDHGGLNFILVGCSQPASTFDTTRQSNENMSITRTLKVLAKTLNVPILILSELAPSLEGRADKRPILTDLPSQGDFDRYADVIAFIYRDEVYHETTKHRGQAEIIIAKNRRGPIGRIWLGFSGGLARFENLSNPQRVVVDFRPTTTRR